MNSFFANDQEHRSARFTVVVMILLVLVRKSRTIHATFTEFTVGLIEANYARARE